MAQRAFDLQLGHGLQAGAVVAVVVHVGAFGYVLQIVFFRNCDNFLEQFMLAQVAAVLGVMGEALDVQLLGLNDDLPDALGLAEGSGLLQFPLGERAGLSCHGDGLVAQRIVGDFQQKGGIHPAGKRHRHTAQLTQIVLQCL